VRLKAYTRESKQSRASGGRKGERRRRKRKRRREKEREKEEKKPVPCTLYGGAFGVGGAEAKMDFLKAPLGEN